MTKPKDDVTLEDVRNVVWGGTLTFGKSAGPRRNAEMARYATHALVIHHGSRGSLDMVRRARAKKLDVVEVRVERERAR